MIITGVVTDLTSIREGVAEQITRCLQQEEGVAL